MADETSKTEEKAEKDPVPETVTVKKKVAKKKSAKKKVAKKKATTKKKTVTKKKVEAKKTAPEQSAESATPTAVAAASATAPKPSASAGSKPAPSNVTIVSELKKDTKPEDSSMTTDSKSASGFWLKVVFWLVIIILGFMYIRSLANNPPSETTATTEEQEAVETSTTADSSAADESAVEESATAASGGGLESGYSVGESQQQTMAESGTAEVEEQTAAASQTSAEADATQAPVAAAGDEATASETPAASTAPEQETLKSIRDLHAESVSKILKEFDELRDATRAEMEAMRNRIQAERELQEAMAPPPAWSRRGYTPYGGYPPARQGYTPYNQR
ncbi:MAG: hypothetical protein B6D77_13735 [gamma proteobacterium symbiont of Ctena orbiculata]|nr:MAG: hypothetical protein B6D77_13735 [gamma proteobacterium symbiont of Ctena orbiculata]PVV19211.1 MAG: hypothetical protein B6D78_14090 [gamma proteobacterium symbiont of Ctena orbiculata]